MIEIVSLLLLFCSFVYVIWFQYFVKICLFVDSDIICGFFLGGLGFVNKNGVCFDNMVYVFFILGSIGCLKGVVVVYGDFCCSFCGYVCVIYIKLFLCVLYFVLFIFDVVLMEVFMFLMLGGCVCVFIGEEWLYNFGEVIVRLCVIWVFFILLVVYLFDFDIVCFMFKIFVCGGEVMLVEIVECWVDCLEFMNGYGFIEVLVLVVVNFCVLMECDLSIIGCVIGVVCVWVVDFRENYNY